MQIQSHAYLYMLGYFNYIHEIPKARKFWLKNCKNNF